MIVRYRHMLGKILVLVATQHSDIDRIRASISVCMSDALLAT